jgi:hypothetical protein
MEHETIYDDAIVALAILNEQIALDAIELAILEAEIDLIQIQLARLY